MKLYIKAADDKNDVQKVLEDLLDVNEFLNDLTTILMKVGKDSGNRDVESTMNKTADSLMDNIDVLGNAIQSLIMMTKVKKDS